MQEGRTPPMTFARYGLAFLLVFGGLVFTTSSRASETGSEQATAVAAESVKTLPADGAELAAPARTLRVWLDHAPNVEKCTLTLEGPSGALDVQGLHTMGADDLMARVVGPMPDGKYTASWTSEHSDGTTAKGTWTFTIERSK